MPVGKLPICGTITLRPKRRLINCYRHASTRRKEVMATATATHPADSLDWKDIGEGWREAVLEVGEHESAYSPGTTKHFIYGPCIVVYRRGPSGSTSAEVTRESDLSDRGLAIDALRDYEVKCRLCIERLRNGTPEQDIWRGRAIHALKLRAELEDNFDFVLKGGEDS